MIEVVAFDLGGVVVDVDKTRLSDAYFGERHDRLSTGKCSADAYVDDVASVTGQDRDRVRAAWAKVVRWSRGGRELLHAVAARRPVHIWSNTDPIHWTALGPSIEAATTRAVLSFRIGCNKPDPDFYAAALRDLDPSRVLYVDDREENVAAAARAGVDAVVVAGVKEARAVMVSRGVL